jgi:putative chitinase
MAQCRQESGFIYLKEIASGADYEGRAGLGNTQSGDGVRFKGRGFIQCTGRNNYASMSKYFGQDFISQPELVEQIEWAAKSVVWFFNVYKASRTNNVNWDDVEAVTHIVNGGLNGIANRKQFYAEYKEKFTTKGINPDPNPISSSGK